MYENWLSKRLKIDNNHFTYAFTDIQTFFVPANNLDH